jgi:hypothetical protein
VDFLFVVWEGDGGDWTTERRQEAVDRMGAYVFDLLGKGKITGGAPLRPAAEAVTVRALDGKPTVIDGPYIETKDVIGGYFIVQAESTGEATELARTCPAADYGAVEIRAIVSMG